MDLVKEIEELKTKINHLEAEISTQQMEIEVLKGEATLKVKAGGQ